MISRSIPNPIWEQRNRAFVLYPEILFVFHQTPPAGCIWPWWPASWNQSPVRDQRSGLLQSKGREWEAESSRLPHSNQLFLASILMHLLATPEPSLAPLLLPGLLDAAVRDWVWPLCVHSVPNRAIHFFLSLTLEVMRQCFCISPWLTLGDLGNYCMSRKSKPLDAIS